MSNRRQINQVDPKAYKGMIVLEQYLDQSDLTPIHKELIKVRTSQINGCGYCLDIHSQDALKNGERIQRLLVLAAWRETELFSEEERLILEMTESIAYIHRGGIIDSVYDRALLLFGQDYLVQLIMCMVTINAWNRIGVSTQMKAKEKRE
ncbi:MULTISPECIES: carboxymuconolactone decarboxylase family protein [Myroides]|uniref:Carboxymuconolactone decarboxylase family protein n=1 Tax=Myroides albus TaxID=2562892 RepID=A0A6I3LM59_9FLAO|nr:MULTISPECIES: carboxymuconolactone decarboxylase family protein [Myroides]MTG97651.1 carboxymuconolactone decarboxylase family protein [Myroides albus]MVX36988.1 carboxymuconolactone decarboxylase family protein [Myroides sp. LoEW2-1]UVD79280.1 carboxymuconolactone decarboxylase family protein [Myroides albus]